jgi:hypothetical protein
VLVAVGIEAVRSEDNNGSRIALRKVPTDTATTAISGGNGEDKPKTGGGKAEHTATPTATRTATGKADTYGKSGSSGSNDSRSEDFSVELAAFFRTLPTGSGARPRSTSRIPVRGR